MNFFLTLTRTIACQNIDRPFWITLYITFLRKAFPKCLLYYIVQFSQVG
jgi:hypothetical protein